MVWTRLTCMENLLVIANIYEVRRNVAIKRAEKLLDDLRLMDKRDDLASSLSVGMKRRLNVAMALIHDPEIVVLDEPTAGLNPQSRLVVTEYIKGLKETRRLTVILTTHEMEIADQLSDRVAIIDHGKLLVLDTPENLKDRVGKGDIMEIALYDARAHKVIGCFAVDLDYTYEQLTICKDGGKEKSHGMEWKMRLLVFRRTW